MYLGHSAASIHSSESVQRGSGDRKGHPADYVGQKESCQRLVGRAVGGQTALILLLLCPFSPPPDNTVLIWTLLLCIWGQAVWGDFGRLYKFTTSWEMHSKVSMEPSGFKKLVATCSFSVRVEGQMLLREMSTKINKRDQMKAGTTMFISLHKGSEQKGNFYKCHFRWIRIVCTCRQTCRQFISRIQIVNVFGAKEGWKYSSVSVNEQQLFSSFRFLLSFLHPTSI